MDTTMNRWAFLRTSTAVAPGLRLSESPAATSRAAIGCVACIVAAMCLEVGCAYTLSFPNDPVSPERNFSRSVGGVLGAVVGGILGASIATEKVDLDNPGTNVMVFVFGVFVGVVAGGITGYPIGDFIGFLVEEEEEETEWYPSTYNWDANRMYISLLEADLPWFPSSK